MLIADSQALLPSSGIHPDRWLRSVGRLAWQLSSHSVAGGASLFNGFTLHIAQVQSHHVGAWIPKLCISPRLHVRNLMPHKLFAVSRSESFLLATIWHSSITISAPFCCTAFQICLPGTIARCLLFPFFAGWPAHRLLIPQLAQLHETNATESQVSWSK